jgi:hypothetical protein
MVTVPLLHNNLLEVTDSITSAVEVGATLQVHN